MTVKTLPHLVADQQPNSAVHVFADVDEAGDGIAFRVDALQAVV